MIEVNFDEFKCRCSAIKKMMATKQGTAGISESGLKRIAELDARVLPLTEKMKSEYTELTMKRDAPPKVELADGAIDYLMEVYAWKTEGMISVSKESMDTLAMRKGKMCEGDAGILLSRYDKVIYKTHKERIENDYLSGEIDLYLGESVYEATNITDIKNASDYPVFLRKINDGLENGQREQVAGYCLITNSTEGWIANCLVDTPEDIILEKKYQLAKKFGAFTTESPEFLIEWEKWERSMKFSHMAIQQRVHKIPVELFTEFEKQKIYDRVKFCRDWLWKFHEQRQKLS